MATKKKVVPVKKVGLSLPPLEITMLFIVATLALGTLVLQVIRFTR